MKPPTTRPTSPPRQWPAHSACLWRRSSKRWSSGGDKTGVLEVCVPGAAELNLKELAAVSGNKHVEMVPLKEVQPLTGYIRGGCSPLAGKKHYPVFVDESAILHERIYVSAGHRGVQLRLAPDDLLRAVEGTYAAIARY